MTDTKNRQDSQVTADSQSAGTPTEVVSADNGKALVKALLPTGAFMTDDHRYYFNGEGPRPSVTTVLEILEKHALVHLEGTAGS